MSTKDELLAATVRVLREQGIAGLSARVIAAEATVNQALIFYHFQTVDGLVEAACRQLVDDRVTRYRARFAQVSTMSELLTLGRELHADERSAGTVAVMAQVMAGGQRNDTLAAAARYALGAWSTEIETALGRVLHGTPVATIADVPGLARAVSAGFVGIELYEGVDPAGAAAALDALERLGGLADVMTDLGPVARTAVQRRLRTRKGKR